VASDSGPCELFQKNRSVTSVRVTELARDMNPRSIPNGCHQGEAGGSNAGRPIRRRNLLGYSAMLRRSAGFSP